MRDTSKLLETDIKALVLNKLVNAKRITQDTTIISELNVDKFSRRVDLALANDTCFAAFEIKSASDSLSRLEGQVETYLRYFDKVTVVAATKHIVKVQELVPKHVGIWSVSKDEIVIKQRGQKKAIVTPQSYIKLMTVGELAKLAAYLKIKVKDKNRTSLEAALASVTLNTLRAHAMSGISGRYSTSSFKFYSAVQSSKEVSPKDIKLLSRFKQERDAAKEKHANTKNAWRDFSLKAQQDFYSDELQFRIKV